MSTGTVWHVACIKAHIQNCIVQATAPNMPRAKLGAVPIAALQRINGPARVYVSPESLSDLCPEMGSEETDESLLPEFENRCGI